MESDRMPAAISDKSVPFRWPSGWNDPRLLDLLKDAPIECLLHAPEAIATAARSRGMTAIEREQAPSSVQFLPDPLWPGIRASRQRGAAESGPTGPPWVNANGWNIRR